MNNVTKKEMVKSFVKKHWKVAAVCVASVAGGYLIGAKMSKKNVYSLKMPLDVIEGLSKVSMGCMGGHWVADTRGLFKLNELGKLGEDVLTYDGNKIPENADVAGALLLFK